MKREVDPKRTRKALRRVARLKEVAAAAPEAGEAFSGWETQFIDEVDARLGKYGSAFANLSKGRPEEALSHLQAAKLREIEAKAKGKPARRGLKRGKPMRPSGKK